jgi:NAD(P)-dependent dehydrogenase (short-subunit alcohol dehydrogenase family)
MTGRLAGKTAVVVGAGQTPGETIGNGRAMALLFAREGARVLCVDRLAERAEETAALIGEEGGEAAFVAADIVKGADCAALVEEARTRFGGLDIPAHRLEEKAFDRILAVNLKGMWLTIKAALPVMRDHGGGSIVNISSLAARGGGIQLAYEVSKAGVNRLTTSVAQSNARYGVRCNAIQMGYLDTPMAVSGIASATGRPTSEVRAERDARVPLSGKMGTGWDTAYAALFLASDEAKFISGAILPVDGAMGVRIG